MAATLLPLAGLAGCASPGSGIQSGEHVTVYVSMPLRGTEASAGRDVVDGARLALAEAHRRVGDLSIRAVYLDDTSGRGSAARWSPARTAANARRATEDSTAIAYVGDFDSGATRFSLPVTNEARMLQVSPASGAVDLAQPFLGAGDQVPDDVQPTGERTFGRVIPSDEVQGEAGAAWAKRLGVRRVGLVSDGSSFGRTLVAGFREGAQGLRITHRGAGLLYYGGLAADEPASLTESFPGRVMGSDSLLVPLSSGGAGARLATSAAEDPAQLPAAGRAFVRRFAGRYRRQPGRYSAYGYEAMAVVLDSIRRAGGGGDDRDSVVSAFFDTQDRRSVLGTYSIDDVGDTTLNRLAGYRVTNGRPVFDTALTVP
jgi:branched-chain amino acid transport system substrate-binding protein